MNVQKFLPTHVGAEPKKLAALGVLVLLAGGAYWMNREPSVPAAATQPRPSSAPTEVAAAVAAPSSAPTSSASTPSTPTTLPGAGPRVARRGNVDQRATIEEFKPSLKRKEDVDVSSIDPTLNLDLLARLREVSSPPGGRSLFEFGQPPPPPLPKVDPIKPKPVIAPPPEPPKPVEQVKASTPPPPPPIPLEFYGYAGTVRSAKQAFFLDGEDIVIVAEGSKVRNRYLVVRVGINSAVVEDSSNNNRQTLSLVEEAQ